MGDKRIKDAVGPWHFARLWRTRAIVRAAMLVERLWPLVLPAIVAASLFLSLAWFGVFRMVPDVGRLALVLVFLAILFACLWRVRLFRAPTPAEIDRRIEAANELKHEPVSVQADRLARNSDAFADALWREHQRRMAERLYDLRGDLPKTSVPERDPFALRAAVALLFVIALAYSMGPYGGRVADAFRPPAFAQSVPARIDAWVTPPVYTARPPIFLSAPANQQAQAFTVPQGSTVVVRVSGGSGEEELMFASDMGEEQRIEPESGAHEPSASSGEALRFSHALSADGTIRLHDGSQEVQSWRFVIIPDQPPRIRFVEEPKRAVNGTLELAYEIKDDYGAVSADTDFRLVEKNLGNKPLYEAPEMPLTLPRAGGENGSAKTSRDLTQHPWAGLMVDLSLSAIDAAGQTASSETRTFVLPQRSFTNLLARSLIEQRQELALDAERKPHVLALMDAVLLWPEETFDDMSHFLLISAVRSRLNLAVSEDALRAVVDDLWEIALLIEDGELTAAERRLRQAQEALKQALEDGASDEEIARLMDELRQAMQDFLREFAERALQNQDFAEGMNGEAMQESDLDQMLDQIEELARSGARDEARDLLSQLESMMNNLQAMRPQQDQNGQQSEMRQQMDRLGDIMRRQQELMNETFRLQQGQEGQQGQGQGQQGEGQQGQQGQGMSPEELAEALRGLQEGQGSLQKDLQSLMEGLDGLGISPGEGFGEAGEAMGEAEGALGQGQGERALSHIERGIRDRGERAVGEQGRALEALRRGAQDMMNQMQQAMQGQDGEGRQGARRNNFGRDPLGRPQANTGPDFGDGVDDIPDEIDTQRARQILEAIRRRLGDALSPDFEREYLERLLEMR
ncbi:TIGR02302 family protein [Chelativorans sp. Marseille-P2723]|uniref:TIGR02302 family protein n=1 Tax=Chelativorans sp. Marseille-P2723 TaxID=2709133 RepID=UPI00157126EC|nr:TIGR02302 family protein [Chelativorans sp. Marseille-P2723]